MLIPQIDAALNDAKRSIPLHRALVAPFRALSCNVSLSQNDSGQIILPDLVMEDGSRLPLESLDREAMQRIGPAICAAQNDPTLSTALDRGLLTLDRHEFTDPDETPEYMAIIKAHSIFMLHRTWKPLLRTRAAQSSSIDPDTIADLALIVVEETLSRHEKLDAISSLSWAIDPFLSEIATLGRA